MSECQLFCGDGWGINEFFLFGLPLLCNLIAMWYAGREGENEFAVLVVLLLMTTIATGGIALLVIYFPGVSLVLMAVSLLLTLAYKAGAWWENRP